MRQVKLREKIKEMETENLSEKRWQLVGEISAKRRPENSLLEEHLFFEHTTKLRNYFIFLFLLFKLFFYV